MVKYLKIIEKISAISVSLLILLSTYMAPVSAAVSPVNIYGETVQQGSNMLVEWTSTSSTTNYYWITSENNKPKKLEINVDRYVQKVSNGVNTTITVTSWGDPVANAKVEIVNSTNVTKYILTTNSVGQVSVPFSAMDAGDYTVIATKDAQITDCLTCGEDYIEDSAVVTVTEAPPVQPGKLIITVVPDDYVGNTLVAPHKAETQSDAYSVVVNGNLTIKVVEYDNVSNTYIPVPKANVVIKNMTTKIATLTMQTLEDPSGVHTGELDTSTNNVTTFPTAGYYTIEAHKDNYRSADINYVLVSELIVPPPGKLIIAVPDQEVNYTHGPPITFDSPYKAEDKDDVGDHYITQVEKNLDIQILEYIPELNIFQPVDNASVVVKDSDKYATFNALTDNNGYVYTSTNTKITFPKDGTYTIDADKDGYRSATTNYIEVAPMGKLVITVLGQDNYVGNTLYTVNKGETNVSEDRYTVSVGGNFTIKVVEQIYDYINKQYTQNIKPVPEANVVIKNSTEYATLTMQTLEDPSGVHTGELNTSTNLVMTFPEKGIYTIEAHKDGYRSAEINYVEATEYVPPPVEVGKLVILVPAQETYINNILATPYKAETLREGDPYTALVGEEFDIQIVEYDENTTGYKPVENASVVIKDQTGLVTNNMLTNSMGYANTSDYRNPMNNNRHEEPFPTAGTYTIDADKDGYKAANTNYVTVSTLGPCSLSISTPSPVQVGQTTTIKVTDTSSNIGVSGATVWIKAGNINSIGHGFSEVGDYNTLTVELGTTDANGQLTTVLPSCGIGDYTIYASKESCTQAIPANVEVVNSVNAYMGDGTSTNPASFQVIIDTRNLLPGDYKVYASETDDIETATLVKTFTVSGPSPTEIKDSDSDGVIDDWDNCPNTPADSWVNSTGCPITPEIRGDFNCNGILDIGDVTKLTYYLIGKIDSLEC